MVETPEGEDVNSLSIAHDPEIFTHLLETRKAFSSSTEKNEIQTPGTSIEKEKSQVDYFTEDVTRNSTLKVTPDYMLYETNQLTITLWGGIEIHTVNRLRATLHIQLKSNEYNSFRDTADLYSHS